MNGSLPEVKYTKKRGKNIPEQLTLHAMALPGMLLMIVFVFFPIFGLYIAFVRYRPSPDTGFFTALFRSEFVGFRFFADIFLRPDFFAALSNTVLIAFIKIVLQTLIGIILALLLNEIGHEFFKKICQSVYFIPFFLSWVVLGSIVLDMFATEGIVNKILGLFGTNIAFFRNGTWFRIIVIFTDVWKNAGYQAIYFLAAITGIDMALYEAAKVDGANYWKQCLHVTIPGIMPIIILVSVLNLGNIMNAGFEQILVLYNPLVYSAGDILDTLAYRIGFQTPSLDQWAIGTAIGLFKSLVSCLFFVVSYVFAAKKLDYNIM